MRTGNSALLVAAHLPVRDAARATELARPADRGRNTNAKPNPRRTCRLAALHSRDDPVT